MKNSLRVCLLLMVPEMHRVKLEDLRTTHLCEAFEMLLSAIIGRIIVMVTKINNEGDDKPWVSSTKEIINDPISAVVDFSQKNNGLGVGSKDEDVVTEKKGRKV